MWLRTKIASMTPSLDSDRYDSTLGIAVADAHIPVAAGPGPEWASPTEGCYVDAGDFLIDYQVTVARKLSN